MYNLSNFCSSIANENYTKDNFFSNLSGVWYSKELDELFDYVVQTRKTKNPLIIAGFDQSVFGDNKETFTKDYNKFIQSLNNKLSINIESDSTFNKLMTLNVKKYFSTYKIPPQDTLILHDKFLEIKKAVGKLEKSEANNYYLFWGLITDNLQNLYRSNYTKSNIRDPQMAENVSFLANQLYKDKKIILWAATLHLHDKPELVVHKVKNAYSDVFMGQFLRKEFQERYFTLAFTALRGTIGFNGYLGIAKRKIKTEDGSLEKYINETFNCDYAFMSTRNIDTKNFIVDNKLTKSNIIGSKPFSMDLTKVVDAYFYIREEKIPARKN